MFRFPAIVVLYTASLLAAETQSCNVLSVHDGDTFTALCGDKAVIVRVSSIDAPELGQTWGSAAKSFVTELLGTHVELERVDRDRYGRVVAKVQLSDGRDLGREMVRAGFAFHYVEYSRDPELAALEEEAKAADRGVWSFGGSQRPTDFRMAKQPRAKHTATRRGVRKSD